MRKFGIILTKIVFKIFYRVEIINANKVPESGAALLCAPHRSMLDMFFIGYKLKRWIYWMAKEELFRNPISGYIFRKLGAFPVKRGSGDIGSIKTANKLLQNGEIVGIFPRGSRKTVKIKPGAAMLAINAGVQIIPVTVEGSTKLFSHIRVIFGDPFFLDAEKDKKYTKEELNIFSSNIMDKIDSLLEE